MMCSAVNGEQTEVKWSPRPRSVEPAGRKNMSFEIRNMYRCEPKYVEVDKLRTWFQFMNCIRSLDTATY